MSLAVAIQMDPIEGVNIDSDTTFALALEAQARGHGLFHYLPGQLSWRQGRVIARVRPFQLEREHGHHVRFGEAQVIDLATVDVVLMRQDPPFNLAYISATHMLDRIHPATLVVNDPIAVRNAPEKLFVTHFHELMPPTLITNELAEIQAFRHEHKDIIVKPLYGNGGAGVFRLQEGDTNLGSLIELFRVYLNEPLMVQRYVPEIRQGDKRIILLDGKPVGALNRVPAVHETRANLHVGGRAEKAVLTRRDRGDLRGDRPGARARRADPGRDRHHRRLPDRDQRDLAHGRAGDRPLRRGQPLQPVLGHRRDATRARPARPQCVGCGRGPHGPAPHRRVP